MSYRTKEGLIILMVDDSESDVFFVERALAQNHTAQFFCAVSDGAEAR
jgi:hypothetical protein